MSTIRPASIYLRRLYTTDARQIARLEKSSYGSAYRAGQNALAAELSFADENGENLSIGLFDKERLVGFILGFFQENRGEVFDAFGTTAPVQQTLAGESIYFADIVLRPRYRRYFRLLLGRFCSEVRRHYPGLPVDAFAVESTLQRWQNFERGIAGFGFELTATEKLADSSLEEPLYWFCLTPVEAATKTKARDFEYVAEGRNFNVELIQTWERWEDLASEWNRLVDETPAGTPFLTHEYMSTWWDTFGLSARLFIVAIYEHGRLVTAAPFQITTTPVFDRHYYCLEFVGDPIELDRPKLLGRPDTVTAKIVARFLLDQQNNWGWLIAYEQDADSTFLAAVREAMVTEEFNVGVGRSSSCPYVDLQGSWTDYLDSRSRTTRKQLRRKLNKLRGAGAVKMVTVENWPDVVDALDRYADVEQRSWKPGKKLGVRKTPEYWNFYQQIVRRLGPSGQVHFRFLELDDQVIAATFGILRNGRYVSLHIAHDGAYDAYSPGVVLTGLELEECFGRADYAELDFLGGFLTNKSSWATDVRDTVTLHVYAKDIRLNLHHWIYFRAKPAIRSGLERHGLWRPALAMVEHLKNATTKLRQRLTGN